MFDRRTATEMKMNFGEIYLRYIQFHTVGSEHLTILKHWCVRACVCVCGRGNGVNEGHILSSSGEALNKCNLFCSNEV